MSAITADDLYEMTKKLSTNERLRLVEKIAHHLTVANDHDKPGTATPAASGVRTRTQLIGQVTELAVDPLRFTIRTPRGDVAVIAGAAFIDNVWSAWGHEVIAEVEAFLDFDGKTWGAVVLSIERAAQSEDLLSNFESTFGSGSEIWATAEARREMAAMRGGGL